MPSAEKKHSTAKSKPSAKQLPLKSVLRNKPQLSNRDIFVHTAVTEARTISTGAETLKNEKRPAILASCGTTAAVKFSGRTVPQSRTISQMSSKSKIHDASGNFLPFPNC